MVSQSLMSAGREFQTEEAATEKARPAMSIAFHCSDLAPGPCPGLAERATRHRLVNSDNAINCVVYRQSISFDRPSVAETARMVQSRSRFFTCFIITDVIIIIIIHNNNNNNNCYY